MSDLLLHLQRSMHFGRHVRPRQMVRRMSLEAQRRLATRFTPKPSLPREGLEVVAWPPAPLFPPRRGMVEARDDGWRITFLNRSRSFLRQIPWTLPDDGPRDQLWKMNLHYMEYLEEVDHAALVELVGDWIAANRPYGEGFWRDSWNSYTLSIRVVVWMQQLAARPDHLPDAFRSHVLTSLHEQINFLERFLETDIGGNHLIKNIKALIWASCFFAGPAAERWRRLGLRLLSREIGEQILPDGMHFERSPSYHCQVFADLLECRHALGGDPLGGILDDALRRMADATADVTHPDGSVVLFNDAGLSMAYAPGVCQEAYRHVFGRDVAPKTHIALHHAGYFGFRADDLYFLADCGAVAPDHLPGHGHGDILSFELSVAGQRVIVDPGVFEYNPGRLRDEVRSSRRHNTVTVDDAEQCDFFGSFRCGRRTYGQLSLYEATVEQMILEGRHAGFDCLPGRPVHVRRFAVQRSAVEIDDHIISTGSHKAEARFLLHPRCAVALQNRTTAEITFGEHRLLLHTEGTLACEPCHWFPDMGVSKKTTAIICRFGDSAACRTEIRL